MLRVWGEGRDDEIVGGVLGLSTCLVPWEGHPKTTQAAFFRKSPGSFDLASTTGGSGRGEAGRRVHHRAHRLLGPLNSRLESDQVGEHAQLNWRNAALEKMVVCRGGGEDVVAY